jgi:hypothetical protein
MDASTSQIAPQMCNSALEILPPFSSNLTRAVRSSQTSFRWRFPLAFQTIPMLVVFTSVWFLPDSPRWLISRGRRSEAIEILAKVRGDVFLSDPSLRKEMEELDAIVESSNHKRYDFHNVTFGRYSGRLHLGRRVCLAAGIMIIMEWTGDSCDYYVC